jgi:N-acetylmuramoyl-L-alanine amidase
MNSGSMLTLTEVCNDANAWGADLFVSVHFNAGGGDGFECYIYNWNRKELGVIFARNVEAIGQNLRMPDNAGDPMGVKIRPNLFVLKNTTMPAVLCEGAFVDNQKDISDWNDNFELQKLGEAYAKAAEEFLSLPKKDVQKPKNYYVRYTMSIGPFSEKETAQSLVASLMSANADAKIFEE